MDARKFWISRWLAPLRARVGRRQYFALHFVIGLVLSVVSLWGFIAITTAVIHQDELTRIDFAFAGWLHSQIANRATSFFSAVSFAGSPPVVGTLGTLAAIVLTVKRRWTRLAGLLAAFVGTGAIVWAVKQLVRRPRPDYASANLHDSSFSFPSGHAMGSVVAYGMLAYLLASCCVPGRRYRQVIIAFTAALVLAIGISRLYLEVHFLSDVIGGFLAGIVWLMVCISGIELSKSER